MASVLSRFLVQKMIDWDEYRSPLELAKQLWYIPNLTELTRLPPTRFQSLFNRVYQHTDELYALWRLGGATNDYLRARPDAFCVPPELPRRLLASHHADSRVVGLKLLHRCNVPDAEVVEAIVSALRRPDEYESCGGICELNIFLDRRLPHDARLERSLAEALLSAVESHVDDGVDVHSGAAHAMARLKELMT